MAATNLNDKPVVRPIPVVNLLGTGDDAYVDALVKEVLPADQVRFRQYMINRPLGLGIITAVSRIHWMDIHTTCQNQKINK